MKFQEIKRDVFKCLDVEEQWHIVHCISRDAKMGAGIAKTIRNRFPDQIRAAEHYVPEIIQSNFTRVLGTEPIIHLVTKEKYYEKPTYDTMRQALKQLKDFCEIHKIDRLAMPRIGCGLDRLEWFHVRNMIREIFEDTDIYIVVCTL